MNSKKYKQIIQYSVGVCVIGGLALSQAPAQSQSLDILKEDLQLTPEAPQATMDILNTSPRGSQKTLPKPIA
jgi:hypothetical protein